MNILCVDPAIPSQNALYEALSSACGVSSIHLCAGMRSAQSWAQANRVDAAFLNTDLPDGCGLELAHSLKCIHPSVRIVFVTGDPSRALEAFAVGAIGYVTKPFSQDDIRREMDKARRVRDRLPHHVRIQTIPSFAMEIDGRPCYIGRKKAVELLALIVDHGVAGVTAGDAIACLWPERPADKNTLALLRMTYKRLFDTLKEEGVSDLLIACRHRRAIRTECVDCDLYRILNGDTRLAGQYAGEYLREYFWAESRNAQLSRMLLQKDPRA